MLVVNHMSKFIKDNHGIMGLTLSHIGLIIATGILLTAVFSIIFLNDWQRNAELKNIATSLGRLWTIGSLLSVSALSNASF